MDRIAASFFSSILDSLQEQITVIDQEGYIVYVNRSWIEFGMNNGLPTSTASIGAKYIEVCGNHHCGSEFVTLGIRDVFEGKMESFQHEYPFNGPDEQRWYMLRASRLVWELNKYVVISHQNITPRKLIEEEVKKLSLQDPLTGLANRRHFNQFWHDEWRRSMRYELPVSLLMIDIDHFKQFNDTEGHLAGDNCLKKVGALLTRFGKRSSDLVARFGGEEFIFILGDSEITEAMAMAESVRKAINDLNINHGKFGCITVSIGVASTVPERQQPEWWLINMADKALYQAKRAGRNRVETTTPGRSVKLSEDISA